MWTYSFTVDHVHDGDTMMGELDLGLSTYFRPISIRLYGVDAPELGTPKGDNARDTLQAIVFPGDVIMAVSMRWDKYAGRIDAIIYKDGEDIILRGLNEGWLRRYNGSGPKPW